MDTKINNQSCFMESVVNQSPLDFIERVDKCLEQPKLGAPLSCVDVYLSAAQVLLQKRLACNVANPIWAGLWYESADAISQQRAQVEQSVDDTEIFYHCMSPETLRALKMSAALCGHETADDAVQAKQCEEILRDTQALAQTCEPLTETFNALVSRLNQLVGADQWCSFDSSSQAPAVVPSSEQGVREEFQMLTDTLCRFAPTMGESRLNDWLLEQGLQANDAQGLGFLILGGASGFSGKVPYGATRIISLQDNGGYVATCDFPYAREDGVVSPETAAN